MTVTFEGTYTTNNGLAAGSGTVTITPIGGDPTVETLAEGGTYSVAMDFANSYTVAEAVNGVDLSSTVIALDGATVDTSKDVGQTGLGPLPFPIGDVHVFSNTGAPGSGTAPGAVNGDLYIRKDAVHGTSDTFYQMQSSSWVGLA